MVSRSRTKKIDQAKENKRQHQLQEIETGRYRQDLVLELQSKFLASKSIEDLQRLERSLTLLEHDDNGELKSIVSAFREQIINELESLEPKGEHLSARNAAVKTIETKVNTYKELIEKKRAADLAAVQALNIRPNIIASSRKLKLKSITCIDPQSNWPKRCDDVYLAVDGKRIWRQPRQICRGETLRLKDEIPFNKTTELQLLEFDKVQDDKLAAMTISKQITTSKDSWTIEKAEQNKGKWHYEIKYEVIN